jgi:hypothetical protein
MTETSRYHIDSQLGSNFILIRRHHDAMYFVFDANSGSFIEMD